MTMKVLYISPWVPASKGQDAGCMTFRSYMEHMKQLEDVDLKLFSLVKKDILDSSEVASESWIECAITKGGLLKNCERVLLDCIFAHRYPRAYFEGSSGYKGYCVKKELEKLRKRGWYPDIIQLETTEYATMIDQVRLIFPDVSIVSSEHDVNFQSLERKMRQDNNEKKIRSYQLKKKLELESLRKADLILVHNKKDYSLLIQEGIAEESVMQICPYYHRYNLNNRDVERGSILFWGAMNRKENYLAATWFIERVMPLLNNSFRLYVVGGNPPKELLDRANDSVVVTGFVEDPTIYFTKCQAMVVPLSLGAGIKVKVLEAMASGIPLLTNDIGIEGIPAVDGESYLHCECPEDYAAGLLNILENEELESRLSNTGRKLTDTYFNLSSSHRDYSNYLKRLGDSERL